MNGFLLDFWFLCLRIPHISYFFAVPQRGTFGQILTLQLEPPKSFTLPLSENMLQKQFRRSIFTLIDLKHGYHQLPLTDESRACTAMSTPLGPLQWRVMPMGVTNGNAAIQKIVENMLEPVLDCAEPFVHDVITA